MRFITHNLTVGTQIFLFIHYPDQRSEQRNEQILHKKINKYRPGDTKEKDSTNHPFPVVLLMKFPPTVSSIKGALH